LGLTLKSKPIVAAILEHLKTKEPNDILFVVGGKTYKVKEVRNHMVNQDKVAVKVAVKLLTFALKANGCQCQEERGILLSPQTITDEQINKTVQMFKVN